MEQLKEKVRTWLLHHPKISGKENAGSAVKQGYRILFTGVAGNDKALAVQDLGKELNKEVHRIDLSKIVSKYIGETEKNLATVFKQAETKNWILFFDEADALFGKRTQVKDSHDRYANQEVSYLLQRIEDYSGIVILATNLKGNVYDAFTRRFHTVLHFPLT